jgi:glycosyltransferase involved in cell wall biosynthesis
MVVYARYPADPRVRREAETLAGAGWCVRVVALGGPEEAREETVGGVRVHRLPLLAVRGGRLRYAYQYLLFFGLAAVRLARLPRSEVVHVHSLPDFLVFVALPARLRGARVVLDLHELMPEIAAARLRRPLASPVIRLLGALERASALVAHRVITVNDTIRALLERRGVPTAKLAVIYNVPAGAVPPPRPPERRLVFVGGLNAERDLGTLIVAASRTGLPVTLFGPAEPAYLERLRKRARETGWQDRVTFAGFLPHEAALDALAASAVGVVTYESNPLTAVAVPSKAFEYALVRRPLVVADLPALRRLFGDAALFYRPGDAEDLAAKIRAALDGGPAVEARVDRAHSIAAGMSWARMAARLLALYEEVAGPARPEAAGR